MMSQTTTAPWRAPRRALRFRWPWQNRPNDALALPPPPSAWRDAANTELIQAPASDRNAHRYKIRQMLSAAEVARALAGEVRPAIFKSNRLTPELRARAAQLVQLSPLHERANGPTVMQALIRERPEIDEKSATLWFATRPNKQQKSPNDIDPTTAQMFEFTRFLVQRGTFNEGFPTDQAPPHYRSTFTAEDLRDSDDGKSKR